MSLIGSDYARIVPTYRSLNLKTDYGANTVIGRIAKVPLAIGLERWRHGALVWTTEETHSLQA